MSDPHPERYLFLRDLLAELQESPQPAARQQVLANIANFAYDPRNATHLLRLDAPRLLLARLADPDPALRRFAFAAVCNLCLEPQCRRALLGGGLLPALLPGLEERCPQTVAACLSTLLLLPVSDRSVREQLDGERLARLALQLSDSEDRRLANLATLLRRQLPASATTEEPRQQEQASGPTAENCQQASGPPAENCHTGDRAVRRVQLSRAMVERFADLSGDTNPVHTESASGTDEPVVHGALLNSLVSAVMGTQLPGPGCLVVRQTLEFPAACRSGDLVEVAVWLTAVRKLISAEFTVTALGRDVTVLRGTAQLVFRQPTAG